MVKVGERMCMYTLGAFEEMNGMCHGQIMKELEL